LKKSPKIIVVTGAESTGKSTLTEGLAKYFRVPYIPEIARGYVEKLGRKYNYSDVETIAKMQIEQLQQFKNMEYPVIFVDTWLIITKIWFEVVFKKVPPWLENEITSTPIDWFLVCNTDIPWVPDPVRENGGENRLILQKKYITEIEKFKFNYTIVSGLNENRLAKAVEQVKLLTEIETIRGESC
jgi:nicotinamide riboside kinase